MLAEIITIGDEILIGQVVDTNSAYISRELIKIGVQVNQITSIPDEADHIVKALEDAGKRTHLVIVTGGLGPTKDDLTKSAFCTFLGDELVEFPEVTVHVKSLLKRYTKQPVLEESFRQSWLPSRATILRNSFGTASGMWMEQGDRLFIALPGVPYEMKHLLQDEVLPRLKSKFHNPFIYYKTLITYGMGESEIAHRLVNWEETLPEKVKLAYLPGLGKVRLRLSLMGKDEKKVRGIIDGLMDQLENILQDIAIGFEDETSIQERIAGILTSRGQTLCLAESCTGGNIAAKITEYPGASDYFMGSTIPYNTRFKSELLGIDPELIANKGVVSAEVAAEMARRSRMLFNTDYALSTTGIAGPSRGDSDQDVGTVFISLASPENTITERFSFGSSRERVIEKATNKAFEMIWKEIQKN